MKEKDLQMNWLKKAFDKELTPIYNSLLALVGGIMIVAITILLDVLCYKFNCKVFRVSNFYDVLMYPLLIMSFVIFLIVSIAFKFLDMRSGFLIYLQRAIIFIGIVLFVFGFFRR